MLNMKDEIINSNDTRQIQRLLYRQRRQNQTKKKWMSSHDKFKSQRRVPSSINGRLKSPDEDGVVCIDYAPQTFDIPN